MIDLRFFSPFGRIGAFFILKAQKSKCESISITFDGFGTRTFNPMKLFDEKGKLTPDANFGDTIEDRLKVMKQPSFKGSVVVVKDGKNGSASFECMNVLYTDATSRSSVKIDGKTVTKNGTLGRAANVYSAPLHTVAIPSLEFKPITPQKWTGEFTPFYQYLYKKQGTKDDPHFVFLGPAIPDEKVEIGWVNTGVYDERLYANESDLVRLGLGLVDPDESENVDEQIQEGVEPVRILMRYAGAEYPLVMSQTIFTVGNVPLSYPVYFDLLKLQVYLETLLCQGHDIPVGIESKGKTFYVDMERHGNSLFPSQQNQNFIREHVLTSDSVATIFDGIGCYDSGIFISVGDDNVFITSSSKTAACFAWSLSYLLAAAGDNTFASMVLVLKQLVNRGYLTPVFLNGKSGVKVLEGRSNALFDGNQKDFDLLDGMLTFRLKRSTTPTVNPRASSGLVLIGCDLHSIDSAKGQPDHYVVGYIDINGRVKAVYDPYRSGEFLRSGKDITYLNGSRDTLFYGLEGFAAYNGSKTILSLVV